MSDLIDNETGERLHPDSTITVPLREHQKLLDEIERLRRELAEARGLLRDIAEMQVHVLPSLFMDESMAEAARAFLAATKEGER